MRMQKPYEEGSIQQGVHRNTTHRPIYDRSIDELVELARDSRVRTPRSKNPAGAAKCA